MHQYLTKLLYLDVDIIFNGSIDYIFKKKESLHSLAAVPDKVLKNFRIGFKYVNELKLHPGSSYLNSGVLLFDIPSWNNQNLTKKILDNGLKNIHLLEGSGGGFAADQPCINFTIQGNWYDLGRESNFPADTFNPKAKIIHFIGNAKPWLPRLSYRLRKFLLSLPKEFTMEYMEKSEFNFKLKKDYFKFTTNFFNKVRIMLGHLKQILYNAYR